MCLSTKPYTRYVAILLSYNVLWYQCTYTWQMCGQWYQCQWQPGYILIHVYFQLPVSEKFGSQIIMHSSTQKNDVSLAKQLQ